ncbi:MAG: bifunctional diaminohydroxyphosphoribosylaminopyrimidine deaminase/5-amino-6-(5-phosphoribosylamino)uracil reductase RibD [Eubacteriales bacterium]|nr:bifunctional diaminohydroxyphosphoribosylaminopyrimidine deaminase/5-amino-6-(5-phosphoribosylamino)uracil reductase RibD [Eubacteriales bacterium]
MEDKVINNITDKINEKYMEIALAAAKRGWGRCSPNPLVGAAIVKNGDIVAAGYHSAAGCMHAEADAIANARRAGIDLKGAELYVNLEPCSHYGRTPPCADAVISAGISRVVIGMEDPNPLVSGKGIAKLREAGVSVVTGVLLNEALKLNEIFIKYITRKLPFVILKTAMTADGKIATHTGDSKWITGSRSREYVHMMRSRISSIMVGSGTVRKDDPELTSRLPSICFEDDSLLSCLKKCGASSVPSVVPPRDPLKIIIDSAGSISPDCRIMKKITPQGVIIAAADTIGKDIENIYKEKGAAVFKTPPDKYGHVDLSILMKELYRLGIDSVLLEGGGELNASALQYRIVDKIMLFMAPKICGGRDAISPVEGEGVSFMKDAINLRDIEISRFEDDILIEGYPQYEDVDHDL